MATTRKVERSTTLIGPLKGVAMSRLRVHAFSISADGYGAGPNQSLQDPLGMGGHALHEWFVGTRTFQTVFGASGGTTGPNDDFAARGFENLGAWILGRNMFAASRGPWPDDDWKGWWGSSPPYHTPVFVLTHHPRAPITMDGGTTFHCGGRKRRAARRRLGDHPAVSAGWPGR
jgi:dihydrofolate reductase